jgi:hypothetical protein
MWGQLLNNNLLLPINSLRRREESWLAALRLRDIPPPPTSISSHSSANPQLSWSGSVRYLQHPVSISSSLGLGRAHLLKGHRDRWRIFRTISLGQRQQWRRRISLLWGGLSTRVLSPLKEDVFQQESPSCQPPWPQTCSPWIRPSSLFPVWVKKSVSRTQLPLPTQH